jgi:hypothetical protein
MQGHNATDGMVATRYHHRFQKERRRQLRELEGRRKVVAGLQCCYKFTRWYDGIANEEKMTGRSQIFSEVFWGGKPPVFCQ